MNKISEGILSRLLDHIPQPGKMLEVGSGSGHISVELARRRPNVSITLNEIKLSRLALSVINAWRRGVFPRIAPGNITRKNLRRRYDLVWSSGLIQCFPPHEHADFVQRLSSLGRKTLLVFPDVIEKQIAVGRTDAEARLGDEGCLEYPVRDESLGNNVIERGVIDNSLEMLGFRLLYVIIEA